MGRLPVLTRLLWTSAVSKPGRRSLLKTMISSHQPSGIVLVGSWWYGMSVRLTSNCVLYPFPVWNSLSPLPPPLNPSLHSHPSPLRSPPIIFTSLCLTSTSLLRNRRVCCLSSHLPASVSHSSHGSPFYIFLSLTPCPLVFLALASLEGVF